MKIALLIHELILEGGGERQCIALACALSEQGHEVVLYTSAFDSANCFPEMCKEIVVKELGRGPLPWLRKPLFIRGYLDMKHLVATAKDSAEVWNPHHWPAQWGGAWLKRKFGGKVVWMCNDVPNFHPGAQHHPQSAGPIRNALYRLYYLYDRAQNQRIDLTILVSTWAERDFKALYSVPTRVLGPGFDPSRFSPGGKREAIRKRFGYRQDDFVLLWLGIFMPHRRLEDAIRALAIVRSRGHRVKLLLAGSTGSFPDYFKDLKELTASLGLEDDVVFAGKVADDEIRDFYSSCDVFLFPNDLQTWGLAVLEAMACGCPVLVSQGSGVQEALIDNQDALLFPPRNPEILSEKIERILTEAPLRSRIAENGRRRACAFTWERYAAQFGEICAELAGDHPSEAVGKGSAKGDREFGR